MKYFIQYGYRDNQDDRWYYNLDKKYNTTDLKNALSYNLNIAKLIKNTKILKHLERKLIINEISNST